MTETADTLVIGSGISGMLVCKELLDAGCEVTLVERGQMRLDADQLPFSSRELPGPSTEHNIEPGHQWMYGYAFGGSSLLWAGVAPRLLPSDFEMRSRFGIWRDWPISYDDLLPFYQEAERLLEVSGVEHELFPGSNSYPVAPPQPSRVDRLLAPLLEPFGPLPLARPAAGRDHYPPSLDGDLSNFEPPNTILAVARQVAGSPGLTVRDRTVASRLLTDGDRVTGIECIRNDGTGDRVRAKRVVAAAHGIENASLLLRSDLDGPAVGRWLGDHSHVVVQLEIDRPIDDWHASTRDSGISYAWADGPWRSDRASAVVIPFNPGLLLRDEVVRALAEGLEGSKLRKAMSEKFRRTLVVYVSIEDAPREDRFVELSAKRDALGIPRSRVSYPPDSEYASRGLDQVLAGLEKRLSPLGARISGLTPGARGGHMLGTCFMGPEGVVDENLCHHRLRNLYVAGGAAFPTHSALHPTTTIAALAVRLGKHLAASGA